MLTDVLKTIFTRDLNKLKLEMEAYAVEEKIWWVKEGITNSAGNLCLHLIGNLNTHIGDQLGKTGYIRNREREFADKNIPRAELIRMIDDTIAVVTETLNKINSNDLAQEYPLLVFENKTSTEYMLVHLATHLTYHLGQINYHRRLLA